MKLLGRSLAARLALLPIGLGAISPQGPGVAVESSSSRIVSPTVVATTAVRTIDGSNVLALLILWRGPVEWYSRPGPRSAGGGGRPGVLIARVQYGGLDLQATLDSSQPDRVLKVQGKQVELKPVDANVVLVDHIQDPSPVVTTLKIDPAMAADKSVEPLLRRSVQIVTFLQCDLKVGSPSIASIVERSCQSIMGK